MTQHELMYKVEQILDDVHTGVLATIDEQGNPQMRWMTPSLIKGRPNVLFAITSPHFRKVVQLNANARVQWMIQTRAVDEVVNLRGKINVLDNPAIRAEVMEQLGKQLAIFWRVNSEHTDFIVLETIIEEATYFRPMKGVKDTVSFA
ncbi:pyridoxamine 5'-phosphate oxidase-related FMN-binding protein [Candidatus Moduliflexus flocculans]|uniref:Pyridoxamine 5'-phosphate oxidase-related FMN-binding protein n=1 Tax=Candidatus Moduliflexus flocculans TaxID=1499966 RepID=A0A0S6VTC1_9BACT|nr:pyridoxamine 5'-phosphate oxidase-related FMN-binding protein [Candidatus Moduliflexus flocculans]